MKQYTTLYREGKKESFQNERLNDQSRAEEEKNIVNLYPAVRYQLIEGFGGAFTDAAGYVYSQMPEELRRQFLRDCFSPDGLGYTFGRTSIDSCDFSSEMYAADNDPEDPELSKMDYTRAEKNLLPLLRDAEKAAGQPLRACCPAPV